MKLKSLALQIMLLFFSAVAAIVQVYALILGITKEQTAIMACMFVLCAVGYAWPVIPMPEKSKGYVVSILTVVACTSILKAVAIIR